MGTAAVMGNTVSGPSPAGVTPARMSGTGGLYTFSFTDANGVSDLGVVDILINDSLNGSGACYLAYARGAEVLYLLNDAGTTLGNGVAVNGSLALSNSQCTLAGRTVTAAGNLLALTLNLTFSSGFAGNKVIYLAARSNGDAQNSGWQAVGTVQVPSGGG